MKKKYWFQKDGTFCLTDPNTGKLWYNQLWNETGYHISVSHVGQGISRYVNKDAVNVFLVSGEYKFLYLRDEKTKDFWNIGVSPSMNEVRGYRCEHGLEYSKITSTRRRIKASWMFTLPTTGTYEIWKVTLENEDKVERTLSLFPAIDFNLAGYSQPFYYNPTTTTETLFDKKLNGILCWSKNPFQPHDRCSGFIASSEPVLHYDGWMEKFNGTLGNAARPQVLVSGGDCTDSEITVRDRGGVLQNTVTLAPGETKVVYYIAGLSTGPEGAVKECREALATAESFCESAVARGLERFGSLRSATPDERINHVMNYWVQKQVDYCQIGKQAVRDSAQIAMALLNFNPELAKNTAIDCLRHQYADGHAMLGWNPVDPHTYSDPPMWLILLVCEVVKETGDKSFLDMEIPYFDEGSDTVYNHLKAALKWLTENYGPDGLPRIHYADWNDALNIPDDHAESVFMAMGVAWALDEMAALSDEQKDEEYRKQMLSKKQELVKRVNEVAWNGDYYVRALSKFGKIGDKDSDFGHGGKIYINPQTWSILGNVVPPENTEKLLKSIDSMDSPYGTPLCMPAHQEYNKIVGRMSGMLPGVYENGGIYNHACGFKIMAECKIGRNEKAVESLRKMVPDGENTPCSQTTTEPYVFTNCYLMHRSAHLIVGFSWQTGASAWALRGFYEGILGLQRTYRGLKIAPALSKEWKHVTVEREFRGCRYQIDYRNEGGKQLSITVDGKKVAGDILPLFDDGKTHRVKVRIREA